MESMIKGSKRIFDFSCIPCDRIASRASCEAWKQHVAKEARMPPADWVNDPIWLLKRRVRELAGGWGRKLENKRKNIGDGDYGPSDCRDRGVYVPDQQGCLENSRLEGGTLGTSTEAHSSDDSLVRLGVAKTKGKFRTVTMQSARVKKILRPVHEALYDHLSESGWLVRGDVSREDFEAVFNDKRKGEKIISGDYTAATDNIYLEAVSAIVDVLAECAELTEEERKVLVGSFTNLRWVGSEYLGLDVEERRGVETHPIKRGSMMGNLVSFPLLCLLNKACFDMACDISYGSGERRIGRFNGDDCLFPGNEGFFALWRKITGSYGLVVNESKTGIEDHWADLNSQPCSSARKGLNPKPVLSFLRPFQKQADGMLRDVCNSIKGLRRDVQAWILNVAMRHEISLRPLCVADLPKRTTQYLLRKSWFRRAIFLGPAPTKEMGVKRTPDVVVANPPLPEAYDMIAQWGRMEKRKFVDAWEGVPLHKGAPHPLIKDAFICGGPYQCIVDKADFLRETKGVPTPIQKKNLGVETYWQFLWPAEAYQYFSSRYPEVILSNEDCTSTWMCDHPLLQRKTRFVELGDTPRFAEKKRILFSPPSLPIRLKSGGVLLPRKVDVRREKIAKPPKGTISRMLDDFITGVRRIHRVDKE